MINSGIDRSSVFGIHIHRLTIEQAIDQLYGWIISGDRLCRYVVTPNLDHAVQFASNDALRDAYRCASLVVADGWPLVAASHLFEEPLPERIAGSDLVPGLFRFLHQSECGGTIFLLGAAPGVAEVAAERIEREWPRVSVVGTYSPPFGFEFNPNDSVQIVKQINASNPDILVVGFGTPKQELWLRQFHHELSVGVAIAGGATIDFLAGRQIRAPAWIRKLQMEWSYRWISDPKRLTGRYVRNACSLPGLVLREWNAKRHQKSRCRPG